VPKRTTDRQAKRLRTHSQRDAARSIWLIADLGSWN